MEHAFAAHFMAFLLLLDVNPTAWLAPILILHLILASTVKI